MKKVGLLGGSFDPIHKGHVDIALTALKQLQLDEVQFIPTKNNPWKEGKTATIEQRLEMIRIATQDYPELTINPIEVNMESNEKNYTVQTLQLLTKQNPDIQYFYLMGMDQERLFDKWKKPKKISQMVQLVAFQRKGYKCKKENLKKYKFLTLKNKPMHASSTEAKRGDFKVLDPKVLYYITNQGLYLETMIKPYMKEKRWKHSCSVAHLAAEIAKSNGLDERKAYIAGMLHDVAKEMNDDKAKKLMKKYFPKYMDKPLPVWHQWLSRYVSEKDFLIDDEEILLAIEHHTTANIHISAIGKCLYVADKLDPLRGYDSSKQIKKCKKNIHEGFKKELVNFYQFSKKKKRKIDKCFNEIYEYFVVKGEI